MANEATVRVSLSVVKRSGSVKLINERWSEAWRHDVAGTQGPTPGAIAVSTDGVEISLAQLTTPGLAYAVNQSSNANHTRIDIGIRDPDSSLFYPLIACWPGKPVVIPLSPDILEEYQGTGTGTGTPANYLWAKAFGTSGTLFFGAFEA